MFITYVTSGRVGDLVKVCVGLITDNTVYFVVSFSDCHIVTRVLVNAMGRENWVFSVFGESMAMILEDAFMG